MFVEYFLIYWKTIVTMNIFILDITVILHIKILSFKFSVFKSMLLLNTILE